MTKPLSGDERAPVVSITVSLEIKDMEYGKGSSKFVSLRSEVPEGSTALTLDEAFDRSLDMIGTALASTLAAKAAVGEMSSSALTERIEKASSRLKWVRRKVKAPKATDEDHKE